MSVKEKEKKQVNKCDRKKVGRTPKISNPTFQPPSATLNIFCFDENTLMTYHISLHNSPRFLRNV